jgi:hypothetical protein
MFQGHGVSRRVWFHLTAFVGLALFAAVLPARDFIRGDSNQDGIVNIADPQHTLNFLFQGGAAPPCMAAADANDDEIVDISDAITTLEVLFLGKPPRLPFPLPGPDPTPGLPCGFGAPSNLSCRAAGPAVDLSWRLGDAYSAVEVLRDGESAAVLPGEATSYRDRPPAGGRHQYAVRGRRGGTASDAAACTVSGLPENQPPVITLIAPAQGALISTDTVEVRGRASDDGGIARILAGGIDVTPAGSPAPPVAFSARIPLEPGPRLIRIEAVDDFGRASFLELAVGRMPLLRRDALSPGVALAISGTTGYGELEAIVRPFLAQLPALIDGSIRGVELYRDTILGVGIRVVGNRAEVSGPIGIDLFPSAEHGGRIGLRVTFQQVTLFADGRSDFGFLGTDTWTATFVARDVAITGTFAFHPRADRSGLEVESEGFRAEIGSSNLTVSGFLDPFGVFDAVVNSLAGVFRSEIEAQVKSAVETTANQQLLPVLAEAFGSLRFDLDLGAVAMETLYNDVLESAQGLAVLFDARWRGLERDPAFPRYPGSKATFPPFPVFPLAAAVSHPVDATISFSGDTLNQAFAELVASGFLKGDFDLESVGSPLPLTAGTAAALIDQRLVTLPGVSPEDPLGLRLEAKAPFEIVIGAGVIGRPIVGEGALWRYAKGTSEPPSSWNDPSFDDSRWSLGRSGFGYSSDASELQPVRTILSDMAGSYASLYLRTNFQLDDPASLGPLLLRVIHDDGFVAYLNGQEVGRRNLAGAPGSRPPFGALAETAIEPAIAAIDLAPFRGLLRRGSNVLALQGHNASLSSSDFILAPELVEARPLPAGTISALPVQILAREIVVTFVADGGRDGVGAGNSDSSSADDVDLFALSLAFRLQAALLLQRGADGRPVLVFAIDTADGPDPDLFPDAIVGGAAGLEIAVAGEAFDIDDVILLEFADFILALFGPALGETLSGLELPPLPLPELVFDLDADGRPDVRLDIQNATFVPIDATGDGTADWICILSDLRAAAP